MKILVTDPLSAEGMEILKQETEVTANFCESPEELLEIIGEYDALIVRSGTQVPAEVIDAGGNLKVIGRAGVGVDNIDVRRATEKGIMVINTPESNTISAAEHTIALLTSLSRNVARASASVKKGEWKRGHFLGVELYEKTLGIIGLGKIGTEVARRCRAMGMHLLGYDPYVPPEQVEKIGVKMVSLEDLLQQSDFITLHLPLVNSTHHIIGEKELAQMKEGVRIINCARGGLIDEQALCNAMDEGKVAGAALDVVETEPPHECPLIEQENVVLTPHLGASTREAQVNVAVQVATQVLRALRGEPVDYAVNVPVLMPEVLEEVKPFLSLMRLLGSLYMQFFGGSVEELEIHYSGEIASRPLKPLTTSCLIGFLQVMVGDQVNYVNAPYLAKKRGLRVKEMSTATSENFSSLITLYVKTAGKTNIIAGTLFHDNDVRIVQIGDYRIEVVPSRFMLVCKYEDKPGVIGQVASILGTKNINIASMQVGRQSIGGEALMVLQVDDPVPATIMEKLKEIDSINEVKFVELVERD